MLSSLLLGVRMERSLTNRKAGPIVDRACYTSAEIWQEELDRIFGKAWLFVAHESELKNPGDFKTTDLAGQPVLAVRGSDEKVRVFFNTCRHRAAIVETDRRGSRQRFQCLYHHWEYDLQGHLSFVPREQGFGESFDRAQFGLTSVPRVEIFHGLVFASLDADAAPLVEYLGPSTNFLSEVATYDGHALEEVGSFEFTYNGNWKLLYENTLDDYHNEYLHGRVYQNVPGFQYGRDYMRQRKGAQASAATDPGSVEVTKYTHSPERLGLHSVLHWHDDAEKLKLKTHRTHRVNIAIFPTLLGIFNPVLDMTTLRIIKPDGPEQTRVLNYCLVRASLSEAEKKAAAARFSVSFGPGGPIMMDDIRVLALVQQGLKAKNAGDLFHTRGLARRGDAGIDSDDHAIRGFWRSWQEFMFNEAHSGPEA
jgi:p-cumate 2,3-dioxygenase alpha subunit